MKALLAKARYEIARSVACSRSETAPTDQDSDRLLIAEGRKVMLLTLDAFEDTQQLTPDNITAWEGCFRMAYHMNREYGKGIAGAAHVGRAMSGTLNSVERLARILYNHYDRNGDSENAVILNNLVTAWKDIRSEMANPKRFNIFGES